MNLNRIGLHLRIKQGLLQIAQEALLFNLKYVQFFLTPTTNSNHVNVEPEREAFLKIRREQFTTVYLHSSYWINPASGNATGYGVSKSLLKKELKLAQKLEIPFIVLHGGVAKDHPTSPDDPFAKKAGIHALAKMLNHLSKQETTVQFLLENCAHGNRTIGNDFNDFIALKQELTHPEKIGFCVDLAHAFAYGYELSNQQEFIETLQKTIGLDAIKLIHFNDSAEACGSKKDQHTLPGTGLIGKEALKRLVEHPALANVPLIIEPPHTQSSKAVLKSLFEDLNTW